MHRLSLLLAIAASTTCGFAQTTLVFPTASYPTIQSAIVAAVNNDTVLVLGGTYQENINFLGKDILVTAAVGPTATTIDGSLNAQPTVLFSTGSSRAARLEGFTITGGSNPGVTATNVGGGIRINGASPTVRGCIVRNNTAGAYGGGIGATDNPGGQVTSPLIDACIIQDNAANQASFASGGGIAMGGFGTGAPPSLGEIRNCTIRRNTANTRGGGVLLLYNARCTIDSNRIHGNMTLGTTGNLDGGAGIFFSLNAVATITNNRIWHNISNSNGGGIKFFNVTGGLIVNNTIIDNTGGGIAGFANAGAFGVNVVANVANCIVWNNGGSGEFAFTGLDQVAQPPGANVSFSDVAGGFPGTGNINVAPMLLNAGSGNHRLAAGSPCHDTGNSSALGLPPTDFEGDARVIGAAADIGADEYLGSKALHWADRATVSQSAPSNITYSVDGGAGRAGHIYVVFLGLSGTEPGLDFGGQHLPLNIDQLTLALNLSGGLNGSGQGSTVLPLGAIGLPRQLIGLTLSSAAAIVGPGPVLAFTNDENVRFVP